MSKRLLIMVVWFLFPAVSADARWNQEDYARFTHETFAALPSANTRIDFSHIDYPLVHAAVFFETNRQRTLNGLSTLAHSSALEAVAAAHSRDMVNKGFFSHTSVVRGKTTLRQRIHMGGLAPGWLAENIANHIAIEYDGESSLYTPDTNGGYFSYTYKGAPILARTYMGMARAVVESWMNSPGHRKNMLSPNFTHMGVGAAHFRDPAFHSIHRFKMTQNFWADGHAGSTRSEVKKASNADVGSSSPSPERFKVHFSNTCSTPLWVLLNLFDAGTSRWKPAGWFSITAGHTRHLADTGTPRFYYYAQSDQGNIWSGDHRVDFNGKQYPMIQKDIRMQQSGVYTLRLQCARER